MDNWATCQEPVEDKCRTLPVTPLDFLSYDTARIRFQESLFWRGQVAQLVKYGTCPLQNLLSVAAKIWPFIAPPC